MNELMDKTGIDGHVEELVSDYVLDLLSETQRAEFAIHISRCTNCSRLVADERQIGDLISKTIKVTAPAQGRLKELRPPVPVKRAGLLSQAPYSHQLVFAAMLIIAIFASMNLLYSQQSSSSDRPESTAYNVTSSLSGTPTRETYHPTALPYTYEAEPFGQDMLKGDLPMVTPAPAPIQAAH